MAMRADYHKMIGPDEQTILLRNNTRIANYHNGIAKIWKELYVQYDGLALVNSVWEFLITEGNHTIQVRGFPNVVKYEISIDKAKKVIEKNEIPPNRVEEEPQHLIRKEYLTPVTIGLYELKSHS